MRSPREFNDWREGTIQIPRIEIDREIVRMHRDKETRDGIKITSASFSCNVAFSYLRKAIQETDKAINRMMK